MRKFQKIAKDANLSLKFSNLPRNIGKIGIVICISRGSKEGFMGSSLELE